VSLAVTPDSEACQPRREATAGRCSDVVMTRGQS
jgi:hypothetical protein